jgi:hypothetical protein
MSPVHYPTTKRDTARCALAVNNDMKTDRMIHAAGSIVAPCRTMIGSNIATGGYGDPHVEFADKRGRGGASSTDWCGLRSWHCARIERMLLPIIVAATMTPANCDGSRG